MNDLGVGESNRRWVRCYTLGLSATDAGMSMLLFRLGFHIPPFSSVHHIHLHVLSLPLARRWSHVKYRPTTRRQDTAHPAKMQDSNPAHPDTISRAEEGRTGMSGKKWGWFVDVRDVKDILAVGKTIKVGAIQT